MLATEDGSVFCYGIAESGDSGIFLLEEGGEPIRVEVEQDRAITSMVVSSDALHYGNVDGKVFKIK